MHRPFTPSDDIVELLKEAANQGRIVLQISTSAPPTEPSAIRALRRAFELRPAEARALLKLQLVQDHATKHELHVAIADGPPASNSKIVGVVICHLRKRLKPHGISISITYKLGYRLTAEGRDKIRRLLADAGAGAIAPPTNDADHKKSKPLAA